MLLSVWKRAHIFLLIKLKDKVTELFKSISHNVAVLCATYKKGGE